MGKGKPGGSLSGVHPVELLGQVLGQLVDRTGIDPGTVDDVLVGCVTQSAEQGATPGRQAWLAAGLPQHVPSTTIERKCGSGQQAVDFAVQSVLSGANDIVIAAGIESMSRVPMGSAVTGSDPFGAKVRERYPLLGSQGVAAELVAHRWNLSRAELDEYSARSHALAEAARSGGAFSREILTIETPVGVAKEDETIRPGSTAESLAGLRAVFDSEKARSMHPDIVEWRMTAGNSSQIADGAGAVMVMREEKASELGLRPRARVHLSSVVADDPVLMLTAPIPATRKALGRAGLGIGDIDAFEVNEAFAPVPLAWAKDLDVPVEKVNPRGGAIALGHPLGASGVRLMTTLLHHLEDTGGRYGLQTMCEAGGMANATIIEAIH